jgi:hypothetical protein
MSAHTSHKILNAVAGVLAACAAAFTIWCAVIAFIGGRIPIFGWELEGGVVQGLLWLAVGVPIVSTVAYIFTLVVLIPLSLLIDVVTKRRPSDNDRELAAEGPVTFTGVVEGAGVERNAPPTELPEHHRPN